MIRLPLIIAAGVVASTAAVVPAVVGLTGNPSFSQQVPVRVPAHASVATFPTAAAPADDRGRSRHRDGLERRHRDARRSEHPARAVPVGTPAGSARGREPEPGDDRGRAEGGRRGGEDG